jgi:hypothetical protein
MDADAPVERVPDAVPGACGLLLGETLGPAARQVERVLRRIVPDHESVEITNPARVVAAFRAKGLVPPRLISACGRSMLMRSASPSDLTPESLAVCFAASVYPQRAFQMWDTGIQLRVSALLDFVSRLEVLGQGRAAFAGFLSERVSREVSTSEAVSWLSDLTGIGDLYATEEERQARERGAMLYLASCYPAFLERTYDVWAGEAEFVRYLRKNAIQTSLCSLTGENRGYPVWSRVLSMLSGYFPNDDASLHQKALILEQMAWKEVGKRNLPVDLSQRLVERFWEGLWDKLTSGFPYYAFASRFSYWWGQCLQRHNWDPHRAVVLEETDDMQQLEAARWHDDATTAIDLECLRVTRENYRLVRTTFFRREDRARSAAEPESAAHENDSLREGLDALWYDRLERRLEGEEKERAQSVQGIVSRFPDLGGHTINMMSHRLRLRIWATDLARVGRRTNAEILSTPRPGSEAGAASARQPLRHVQGVLAVAPLARMIPTEHTLLWAFTAHVFLHPWLNPQRPDPWTFPRYVRELWHWVSDDAFAHSVEEAARTGSRSNVAALAAMSSPPFVDLLRDLRTFAETPQVDAYLASRSLAAEERAAVGLVREFVDDLRPERWVEDMRRWRRLARPYWIVPVWFLTIVEHLDRSQVLARLRPSPDEVESVVRLYDDMSRFVKVLS